jgi:hypothetical protein
MPVTIAPDAFELWLDCANVEADVATSLLIAPPLGTFAWHEVSTAVNRVANDDARLIEPVSEAEAAKAAAEAQAAKPRAKPRKTESSDQGSLF